MADIEHYSILFRKREAFVRASSSSHRANLLSARFCCLVSTPRVNAGNPYSWLFDGTGRLKPISVIVDRPKILWHVNRSVRRLDWGNRLCRIIRMSLHSTKGTVPRVHCTSIQGPRQGLFSLQAPNVHLFASLTQTRQSRDLISSKSECTCMMERSSTERKLKAHPRIS